MYKFISLCLLTEFNFYVALLDFYIVKCIKWMIKFPITRFFNFQFVGWLAPLVSFSFAHLKAYTKYCVVNVSQLMRCLYFWGIRMVHIFYNAYDNYRLKIINFWLQSNYEFVTNYLVSRYVRFCCKKSKEEWISHKFLIAHFTTLNIESIIDDTASLIAGKLGTVACIRVEIFELKPCCSVYMDWFNKP